MGSKGTFTVKSNCLINNGVIIFESANIIWKVTAPSKFKVFLWLVSKDTILIRDNLIKREVAWPDRCVLSSADKELVEHLLLQCPFAAGIWYEIMPRLNIRITPGCIHTDVCTISRAHGGRLGYNQRRELLGYGSSCHFLGTLEGM